MSRFVRSTVQGDTYFFTARAARRGDDLFTRHVEILRQAVRKTRETHPFVIDEIVVLPDTIHTLWTLPEGDTDFSRRWRMLKSLFSRAVDGPADTSALRLRPGEKGLWQRRFWEHQIRDVDDLAAHRHLIFCAPVQAGLVSRPEAWPYSSIHRAIARGAHVPDRSVDAAFRPAPPRQRTPPPDKVA